VKYFRPEQFFGLKILIFFVVDPDPGSCAFLALDSGSEMGKFGSGINIMDPELRYRYLDPTMTLGRDSIVFEKSLIFWVVKL
jgi:hypothetical protein